MEQNLFEAKGEEYDYHFPLQHKNENFYIKPAFKEWYKTKKEFVKKENEKRRLWTEENLKKYGFDERFLVFSYCPYCISYAICYVSNSFSSVKCSKCRKNFCIGCYRKQLYENEETVCLKGFLILFYHRVIDQRSSNSNYSPILYFLHILVCLFITPIYLGMIFTYIGFAVHKNKRGTFLEEAIYHGRSCLFSFTFSLLRGLLMFPYIIPFFPFMVILLLPGLFSYNYYIYIYNMYITVFMPGGL